MIIHNPVIKLLILNITFYCEFKMVILFSCLKLLNSELKLLMAAKSTD